MNINDIVLDDFFAFAGENDTSLENAEELASKKQCKLIHTLFSELDMDKTDFKIEKVSKLSMSEAKDLIDQLYRIKDERDQEELEDEEGFLFYCGEYGENIPFGL